jgi:hypothetical protein
LGGRVEEEGEVDYLKGIADLRLKPHDPYLPKQPSIQRHLPETATVIIPAKTSPFNPFTRLTVE